MAQKLTLEGIAGLAEMLRPHGAVRIKGMEDWIDPSLRGVPTVDCDMGRDRFGRSIYLSYRLGDLAPETVDEVTAAVADRTASHRADARRVNASLAAERDNQR